MSTNETFDISQDKPVSMIRQFIFESPFIETPETLYYQDLSFVHNLFSMPLPK